jgi:hypothetical protein
MESALTDADLLRRQDELQAGARRVLGELQVLDQLRKLGEPVIVGSLALGLMVWRDIDLEVQCPRLNSEIAFDAVRYLVSRPGAYRLVYHDFTGARAIPAVPEGYYWGVRYQPEGTEEWKLDIWLLPAGRTRRSGVPLVESMRAGLTEDARLAILRLKHLWFGLPAYRDTVLSTDIYDAVLAHGVRTPEELDAYLRERGKTAR